MNRRHLISAGAGLGLAAAAGWGTARAAVDGAVPPGRMLSAADFGAAGDGRRDDTDSLQKALDATFGPKGAGFLVIPPGTYRVTRTLKVDLPDRERGNVTHLSGITARGARLRSEITDGGNVFEMASRAVVRFVLIEGLDIRGSGREGHGIYIDCNREGSYIYNFCLRDTVVQGCGQDGCRMIGNIFEGQLFNSYFRDNKGNGATFGHGDKGGVLSAVHAFGCVFGGNGRHGVDLINKANDVSFYGCYFLLNGKFGLSAGNGCSLLAHCGFENNHRDAKDFEHGDAGLRLQVFGTLIGCTAYSIYKQTHLIRAFVTNRLVMIGCTGSGGGAAKKAGLARLKGGDRSQVAMIGCQGAVGDEGGVDVVEIGQRGAGIRVGADWNGGNLAQLGDYRLWVDGRGRLRIKKGRPDSDEDGSVVGA